MSGQGAKVPPLRFQMSRVPWGEKRLGDFGKPFNGLNGKTKADFGHGEGRYVTYLGIFSNPIVSRENCAPIEVDTSQNAVNRGDVFFTTSSETPDEVGMSAVWLDDAPNTYLNSFCFGFRPNGDNDSEFLAYLFRSSRFRNDMSFLAQGISRYNISKGRVMDISVALPSSLPDQRRIGSFFRTVDVLIAVREKALGKLEALKKSMLLKMFPQGDALVPEVRFKGFEGEWEKKRLREMVSFSKGKGYSKSDISDSGTQLFLYGRMYTDYMVEVNSVDTCAEMKKNSVVSDGDEIVVPGSGETPEDIARASAIMTGGIILGGDLNVLKPKDVNEIYTPFLAMALSNGILSRQIAERAQGKTVVHIHNSDLESLLVPFPSRAEQQKIGAYFRSLDALIAARREEVEKLRQMKKALLERMFV